MTKRAKLKVVSRSGPPHLWRPGPRSAGRQDRPGHRPTRFVPTLRGLAVTLVVGGFCAFQGAERFPEFLGPVVALSSLGRIEGRVTHVRDGDTIEVGGVPVRLGSLDCAERDTIEGRRATSRMKMLVSGKRLQCSLNGRTSYDRKIGSCSLPDGRDLGAILIGEGLCGRFW